MDVGSVMAAGPGTRAMRLLATRVIDRRDSEAALVLGDAMMEHGISGIITGRSRPVLFRTYWPHAAHVIDLDRGGRGSIATPMEVARILRVRAEEPTFRQQAREVLYNVTGFAREPTETSWGNIWSHWVTPWRGTYQAMVAAGILPASIRFLEFTHRDRPQPYLVAERRLDLNPLLAYGLYLTRVPRRRKLPVSSHLFDVHRLASDNPRTDGAHFKDDGGQLGLFDAAWWRR